MVSCGVPTCGVSGPKEPMELGVKTAHFFSRETSRMFRNRIGRRIREEVEVYLKENSLELRNETAVYSDYTLIAEGEYEVTLDIRERGSSLVEIRLPAPDEAIAESMCERWQEKAGEIYADLTGKLF